MITGSPNMVCTVNHAMKELQHKILYVLIQILLIALPMKMERAREREKRLNGRGNRTERNRRATAIQVGKTEYCTCDGLF